MEVDFTMRGYSLKGEGKAIVLHWRGKDLGESALLRFSDGSVQGNIHYGKNVYSVKPLGNGLHAFVLIDQSK